MKQLNSTVFTVLMLFYSVTLFPLEKSVYITPAYDFTLSAKTAYREKIGLSNVYDLTAGLNGRMMVYTTLPYLHLSQQNYNSSGVYDPQVGFRLFINNWDEFFLVWETSAIIPFGISMYDTSGPVYFARGVNQLSSGFNYRYKIQSIYIHGSLFHNFLEASDYNMYKSIYINPVSEKTWFSVCGLNPFYDGAFLSPEKLKNDWYYVSMTVNTEVFIPVRPGLLVSYSSPYIESKNDDIVLAGIGESPLDLGVKCAYFITEAFLIDVFFTKSFLVSKNYPSFETGIMSKIEF
jgi:hypothetical protein